MERYDALTLNNEKDPNEPSLIKDYFKGRTVLLTGGLGFLGQLYVEKLLRQNFTKSGLPLFPEDLYRVKVNGSVGSLAICNEILGIKCIVPEWDPVIICAFKQFGVKSINTNRVPLHKSYFIARSKVKEIYLIARDKKGKTAAERCFAELTGPLYSKLNDIDPNYLKRIRIVLGDLTKENLALSSNDLKDIYENVNIILHAAADVRFGEKLLTLISTNLKGTRDLLRIAENTKNFEVFAYISTAYSNSNNLNIDEKFYEPPMDPETAINFSDQLTTEQHDVVETLTDAFIKNWPNTYTFTKCLSEDLVRQYGKKFPVIVMRPTIVISTYEDPISGWCNNVYGLNGVSVACGLGFLRIMPFKRKLIGDIICADFVVNSTMAAIWFTHKEQMKLKEYPETKQKIVEPEVYFVGSSVDRPLTWQEISEAANRECNKNPPEACIWKQCQNNTTCPFLFFYYSILFHFIPAALADISLSLFTKKKIRVLPYYVKAQKFVLALRYFMQTEFKFTNKNMKKVLSEMKKGDHEFYPSDVSNFDWQTFSYNYVLGLRRFIVKEYPLNPNTQKKHRIFRLLHILVLALFYGFHLGLLYLLVKWLQFI